MDETNYIPEDILKQVVSGDHKGFSSFYDITYPLIFRFVHYFLPCKRDCEEVISEIYYNIWKKKEHLLAIQNLKSWLYIVSRNEAFHYIKQKKRYQNIAIDNLPVELSINTETTDGQLIEKEMVQLYNKAVSELPERCKLIFIMAREEHLKNKEIAEILSIKEGTVEQQMNIAIRKIISTIRKTYPHINKTQTKVKKTDPFIGERGKSTLSIIERKKQL